MININLLPAKSFIHRLVRPLFVLVILLTVWAAYEITQYGHRIAMQTERLQDEIGLLQMAAVPQLQPAEQRSDTEQLRSFAKEIDKIKAQQQDWKWIIDELHQALPVGSRMGQTSTDGSMIQTVIEFSDKMGLVQYIDELVAKPFVHRIDVTSVTQMQRTNENRSLVYYQVLMSLTLEK